jgi:hypothetical protein
MLVPLTDTYHGSYWGCFGAHDGSSAELPQVACVIPLSARAERMFVPGALSVGV